MGNLSLLIPECTLTSVGLWFRCDVQEEELNRYAVDLSLQACKEVIT
jgi:hypothetical protein